MLLYSAEKNAHVGLIPKDQGNFLAAIKRVITSTSRKVQDQAKQKMVSADDAHFNFCVLPLGPFHSKAIIMLKYEVSLCVCRLLLPQQGPDLRPISRACVASTQECR